MVALAAGSLNSRVTIQRLAARSGFGKAGQESWEPVATVWAQVQDVLPSRAERIDDGLRIASRPARIRMRYRRDITADMRIVFGDRIMQIVAGPAVLGNRDGIEIMAADYSTVGGQP